MRKIIVTDEVAATLVSIGIAEYLDHVYDTGPIGNQAPNPVPRPGTTPPSNPDGTAVPSWATKQEFLTWANSQWPEIFLDGKSVKPGGGPPVMFYIAADDGRIYPVR